MGTSKCLIFKLFVIAFCFSLTNYGSEGGRISISKEEDLELERQLKILNKPPIKTIHTEWGDIVDCIDIHKQPAFDHPSLKNHKLQMAPTFSPQGMITEKTSKVVPERSNIRTNGIECPKGTVPIKRTTKEDLIRAKSFAKTTKFANDVNPSAMTAVIILENEDEGTKYFGASADMYTYNPSVGEGQFSAAQIWVENGPTSAPNSIQAGWIVAPQLYKDNLTRLFTYWAGDGSFVKGCYNTLCPGFVQVDPKLLPSNPVEHISTYGGKQYVVNLYISKAEDTGNWWLITEYGKKVGYWPNNLFNRLNEGAERLKWGGSVSLSENGMSPPMGSGHYPDGQPNHSCNFINILIQGQHGELTNLGNSSVYGEVNCKLYGLSNKGFVKGSGNIIEVGGPGGKCR